MSTIRDVAIKAGVHPSTVSRVFSGNAKISQETQTRVLDAAQKLYFHPNAIARSLSVKRTCTIAIVIPHIYSGYFDDEFFPQVVQGLLNFAYPRGYRILVGGSNSHSDEIVQTFDILGSRQADGIVVLSNRLDVDTVGAMREQDTPFVLLGRPPAHYHDVSWVDADNERYTYEAINYLIGLGHKRIAYVGGDPEVAVTSERQRGYASAMTQAQLPQNPRWIEYGYFSDEGGYYAVQRMTELGDEAPTAYYAANDLMAFGILRGLREKGVSVPEQVSVIGTNDSGACLHVTPTLTTLRVPYAQMAAQAAELLIQAIEEENTACTQRYVDCELMIRQSTGPCPD